MKTVDIKIYNKTELAKSLQVVTKDGKTTVIKADKNVNYEFFDHSIGRAPNHVITKRVGKNLHVSFEREGQEDDLIIEDFFAHDDHALIGVAEDGNYYYYIPDTGEVADYVTQLVDGAVEGQALGGEHLATPLWVALSGGGFPWWLAGGVIPFLIDNDDDPTPQPQPQPQPTTGSGAPIYAANNQENRFVDKKMSEDNAHLSDSAVAQTIKLTTPTNADPSLNYVVSADGKSVLIVGVGTYTLDNTSGTPVLKFESADNYTGSIIPPIDYTYEMNGTNYRAGVKYTYSVDDKWGAERGMSILIDLVEGNAAGGKDGEVDPASVRLINKDTDLPIDIVKSNETIAVGGKSYIVTEGVAVNPAEGKYHLVLQEVGGKYVPTGEAIFVPAKGYTGTKPEPINYVIDMKDTGGVKVETFATITVHYADASADVIKGSVKDGKLEPVTVNVIKGTGASNKGKDSEDTLDVTSIKIIDPKDPVDNKGNPKGVDTIKVDGQGTWEVVKGKDGKPTGEITFTPEPTFVGNPTPINYTINDNYGNQLLPTPVAVVYDLLVNPDTKVEKPGMPVTVKVTDNDESIDISTIKIIDETDPNPSNHTPVDKLVVPGQGTWEVVKGKDGKPTGEITFTPEPTFTGNPDPIHYQGVVGKNPDGSDKIEKSTVNVIYLPENESITMPDTKSGEKGKPVTIDVTANDGNVKKDTVKLIDPENPVNEDGTPKLTDKVVVPDEGTWEVVKGKDGKPTGEVKFTPVNGFTDDPAPINYVTENNDGTPSQPTPINVTYPNLPELRQPLSVGDKGVTPEGTPLTGNVLENDRPGSSPNLSVKDFSVDTNGDGKLETFTPGSKATIQDKDGKPIGELTIDPDGKYTFVPANQYNGEVPDVNYTLVDGFGNEDTTKFNITVTPVPDAPVATPDEAITAFNTPVTIPVLNNDHDPDSPKEDLTVQLVDPKNPTTPTNTVTTPEGVWTVTPDNQVTFTPNDGFSGTPTPVNYIVTDKDNQTSNPTPITVTVRDKDDKNTAPVAENNANTGNQGKPVTGNVIADEYNGKKDSDPENDKLEVTEFTVVGITTPIKAGDTATIPNVGTLTINKDGDYTFTPEPNFAGDMPEVTYTIKDTGGLTDTATLNIDISAKPVATPDTGEAKFNTPVTIPVLNNDHDPDSPKEDLTVQLVDPKNPTTPTDSVTTPEGVWTVTPDNQVTFTPNDGFSGTPTPVNYIVTDKEGNTSEPTPIKVSIATQGNEKPPVAQPDSGSGNEDSPITGNVLVNDSDPENQPLSVTEFGVNGKNVPAGDSITIDGVGTITINDKGDYTFTPVENYHGSVPEITYTVTDGALTSKAPLNLTVNPIPDAPVADNNAIEVKEGSTGSLGLVEPKDPDSKPEDLTIKVTKLPNAGEVLKPDGTPVKVGDTLSNDELIGLVYKAPTDHKDVPNVGNFEYVVTDETGLSNTGIVEIAVKDVPSVSLTGLTEVNEAVGNVEYTIHLDKASDEDTLVTLEVKDGTAKAGEDYTPPSVLTVVIPKGQTTATIRVAVTDDEPYEGAENYVVNITNVENGMVDTAKNTVTTTIKDDGTGTTDGRDPFNPENTDPAKPFDPSKPVSENNDPRKDPTTPPPAADNDKPTLTISNPVVTEGVNKHAVFTLTLDNALTQPLTLAVALADDTANAGTDYETTYEVSVNGVDWQPATSVTIPADTTSVQVRVPVVDNDILEPDETFTLTVTDATGTLTVAQATGTATIKDDDATPSIVPTADPKDPSRTDLAGYQEVQEATGTPVQGEMTIVNPASVATITVAGKDITNANTNPVEIDGVDGKLTITGYDKATGKITYTYTENGTPNDHTAGDNSITDEFAVEIQDTLGNNSNKPLVIRILDTEPVANDDADQVGKAGNVNNIKASTTGNVITGQDGNLTDGVQADTQVDAVVISDVNGTPVTTATQIDGKFGTLTINPDGTYSYQIDTTKPATKALVSGEDTDSFTYTIKDADGDEATAKLDIKVVGAPEPTEPTFTVSNPIVAEADGAVAEFTVTVQGDRQNPAVFSLGNEDGSALAGDDKDYKPTYEVSYDNGASWQPATELNIPAGNNDVSVLVRMPIVNDDIPEPTEMFKLVVTDTSGQFKEPEQKGVAQITDNDPVPVISNPAHPAVAGELSVPEGEAVAKAGTLKIDNPQGVATLTINGQDITNASTNPVEITTAQGKLTVTGYDKNTGEIRYEYTEDGQYNDHTAGDITDTFAVKLVDVLGGESEKPLVIIITDTEPTAVNDNDQVEKAGNTTTQGNIMTGVGGRVTNGLNADDAKDNATLTQVNGVKVPQDDTTVEIIGTYGKLTIKKDGTYTYELDKNDPETQALADGQEANEVFDYTITDQDGDQAFANLTIKVIGSTDKVLETKPNTDTVTEDSGVNATGNLVTDDVKVDPADTVKVTNIEPTSAGTPAVTVNDAGDTVVQGKYGTLTVKADGSYTYDLNDDHAEVDALNDGDTLQEVFTYTATDGKTSPTNTLTITIDGNSDVALQKDYKRGVEDTTLTVDATDGVLANDQNLKGKTIDSATFNDGSAQPITIGTATTITKDGADIGKLTLNADGSYTFEPAKDYSGALPEITYHVGGQSTTLQIDIAPQVEDITVNTATGNVVNATLGTSPAGIEGINSTIVTINDKAATSNTGLVLIRRGVNPDEATLLDDGGKVAKAIDDLVPSSNTTVVNSVGASIYRGTLTDTNSDGLLEGVGLKTPTGGADTSYDIAKPNSDPNAEISQGVVSGTGRLLQTWVYLKAGDQVGFKGEVDDGLKIELAGKDMVWSVTDDSYGAFDSTTATSTRFGQSGLTTIQEDGYYSLHIYNYNATITGAFDVVMTRDGENYFAINTNNFDLYKSMADVKSQYVDELKTDMRDNKTNTTDSDDKEGYYVVNANGGAVGHVVKLNAITFDKANTDASNSTTAGGVEVEKTIIKGLPDDAVVSDGANTATITAGEADITGFDLTQLTVTNAKAGSHNVTVSRVITDTTQLSDEATSAHDTAEGKGVVTDDGTKEAVHTKSFDATFVVNIAPTVEVREVARVSEEGLAGGEEDDTPALFDKTRDKVDSGTILVKGVDDPNNISVELTAPTTTLTSEGQAITWSVVSPEILEATRADGTKVMSVILPRASMNPEGADSVSFTYTTELFAPIDHDNALIESAMALNFGVVVKDGATTLVQTNKLMAVVEDDIISVALKDDYKRGLEDTIIDVPVSEGLLANDTGATGQSISKATLADGTEIQLGVATAITANGVNAGQLTLRADGSYKFEPAQDYSGAVPAITYTVGGKTAQLQIDIAPQVEEREIKLDDTVGGKEVVNANAESYITSGKEGINSHVVTINKASVGSNSGVPADVSQPITANDVTGFNNGGTMAKALDDKIASNVDTNHTTLQSVDAIVYRGVLQDVNNDGFKNSYDGGKIDAPETQMNNDPNASISQGAVTGTGRLIQTWVYLKAGDKVAFKGYADDGLKIELAGMDMVWGTNRQSYDVFDSTNTSVHGVGRFQGAGLVEIPQDGYYSLHIYNYNASRTGGLDVTMTTNGRDYFPIDTEHFDLYADMKDVTSPYINELRGDYRTTQSGHTDSDDKEGYYLAKKVNQGQVGQAISLQAITINAGNTDDSSELDKGGIENTTTKLTGVPEGATITDGTNSVTVDASGEVDVSDFDLTTLSITTAKAGVYTIKVVQTVTDTAQLSNQANNTGDTNGVVTDNDNHQAVHTKVFEKDLTVAVQPKITLAQTARVSEEGLAGGQVDMSPSTFDTTSATKADGRILIEGLVTNSIELRPVTDITSGGKAVTWRKEGLSWVAVRTEDDAKVMELTIKGVDHRASPGNTILLYETNLLTPIDHKDSLIEDNLGVVFDVVVKAGGTVVANQKHALTVVEDDAPVAVQATHNIDVPKDIVVIDNVHTGFKVPSLTDAFVSAGNPLSTGNGGLTDTDGVADGYEKLWWNQSAYSLTPDTSGAKGSEITQEFNLGRFTHENQGSSGRLYKAQLDVSFDVSVNGIKQNIAETIDIHHFETVNSDLTKPIGQGDLILLSEEQQRDQKVTADDFVLFELKDTTHLIDGKRYTLEVRTDRPNSVLESLTEYNFMRDHIIPKQVTLWGGEDSSNWKNLGKELSTRVQAFVDKVEASKTDATLSANSKYKDLDNDGYINDIERGKLLVLRTKERENSPFNLIAQLVPVGEHIEINDDLNISGKLIKGADRPSVVKWSTPDTDDDIKVKEPQLKSNGDKVFETIYGDFTANTSGSYRFVAKSNLGDLIKNGTIPADADKTMTFEYEYTDADGDKVKNKVVINLNDYEQSGIAYTDGQKVGTDNHDYLKGTSKAGDVLRGGRGDDTLEGYAGADFLYGGEDNDYFIPSFVTNKNGNTLEDTIYGESGFDTIILTTQNYVDNGSVQQNGNFSTESFNGKVFAIEALDLGGNSSAEKVTIRAQDVIAMTDDHNTLYIKGGSVDTVDLSNQGFTKGATTHTEQDTVYDIYTHNNGATLYIENSLKVSLDGTMIE